MGKMNATSQGRLARSKMACESKAVPTRSCIERQDLLPTVTCASPLSFSLPKSYISTKCIYYVHVRNEERKNKSSFAIYMKRACVYVCVCVSIYIYIYILIDR